MPEKVVTLILKVDLECCRCKAKVQKVLCKLQKCVPIQLIGYDEKNNVVIVSGPFDPECVSRKLRCMASCKVIKDIKLKPDPPPPPPPEKKPDPPPPEKKPDPPPPEKNPDPTPPETKPDPPPPEKKPDPPPPEKKPDPPPPETKPDPPPPEKKPDPPPPEEKPDPPPPPEKEPDPPPPMVLKLDWQWPSSPPPWSTCCVQPCPCYQAHHGCSRCCSCGKVVDEPPQPYPYPAYYYPPPPVYGGGHCEGVKIVCEQDPPYLCNIM